MPHPVEILERYWGFTSFRPLQEDIISSVINGEDTLALMPTGGGKSLCFQIPALAKDGICIVISPLIALMKDQVKALKQKGIKSIALTGGLKYDELGDLLDNCIYGNYKFLYLSPERLQQEIVQDRIRQMNVNLIAVDEAHCISQWGNDFRPAYKNIKQLRELQPTVNIIALTASATKKVTKDIVEELDFINPQVFKQSFKRPNIAYMVFETADKYYKIEQILSKNPESSIIYVRSRKQTIEVSSYLERKGFSCTYYHGGLTNKEKEEHFNLWKNNQKLVMVATNAFGMGIDKPDVKTVIHINLPESIESYFQEAGRAGRNNNKAYAIILKNKGDEIRIKNQFLNVLPTVKTVKQVYRKLCSYFQVPYAEGEFSTFEFNFNHFCKTYNFNTHVAYNALQILDRNSIIALTRQFQNKTVIRFLVTNTNLFSYLERHVIFENIVKAILRTYGGVLDQPTKINTALISDKVAIEEDSVIDALKKLKEHEIISLQLNITDAQITFLVPREDDKTINRISKVIEQQNALKTHQVSKMIAYINNDSICKSKQLLAYFGETDTDNCGICSVCISSKIPDEKTDEKKSLSRIISVLEEKPLSSRQIVLKTNLNEDQVQSLIRILLEEKTIEITSTNTYKLKT